MAETFPSTLQDKVNVAGFSHSIGDTIIRSEVDVGLAKVRRRYTKGIDMFETSIDLDIDDYNTLYNFYNTTLNGGTLTFNYENPLTQTTSEFRFKGPPQITPLGGRYFRVNMSWEEMP